MERGGSTEYLNSERTKSSPKEEEKEKDEKIDTSGVVRRILKEGNGICLNALLGSFGASVVGVGMSMFALLFGEVGSNFNRHDDLEALKKRAVELSLIFVAVGVGTFICSCIQFYFYGRAAATIVTSIQKKYFQALLRQEVAFFDQASTGVLNAKISSEIEQMNNGFGQQVAMAVEKIATAIAGLCIAFSYSWRFTLMLFIIIPFVVVGMGVQMHLIMKMMGASEKIFRKSVSRSSEVLSGIRTVKSLNAEAGEVKRFTGLVDEMLPVMKKGGIHVGAGLGFTWLVMFAGMYGFGMWYGSVEVVKYYESGGTDGIDGGGVFGVFFGVFMMAMGLGQFGPAFEEFKKAKVSAARLYKIIDRVPESRRPTGTPKTTFNGSIMLENVSFRYPTRPEKWIFKDFSLSIKAGQTVALVGPSGCGKSTIVSMIERFYEPENGKVLIDGVEVHEYDLNALRKQIGFVGQEPILFNMTIAENIKMGVEDEVTMEDIVQAAKMANAYEFIMGFPDKFDTIVGEKGSQMSGGQKQRISIARALCRKPKILLLDEATSALDTESEAIVQAALDKIMRSGDLTCIVIAHRLSTVKDADKIAVIHEGRVDQQGTHNELAADDTGIYATMLKAQQLIGSGLGSPRKTTFLATPTGGRSPSPSRAELQNVDLDDMV